MFIREVTVTDKSLSSLLKNIDKKIYINNEVSANQIYRYWVSPVTSVDQNWLLAPIPDELVGSNYLLLFNQKVPVATLYYGWYGSSSLPTTNIVPINKVHNFQSVKLFTHARTFFSLPFTPKTITASYQNPNYPVSNIYNDTLSDRYINDSGSNQTITIEFEESDVPIGYTIFFQYPSSQTSITTNFSQVQISSDGNTWSTLSVSTGLDHSYTDTIQNIVRRTITYTVSTSSTCKFIRFTVPNGMFINKIAVHRSNNGIWFNNQIYFKKVSSTDLFTHTSTTNIDQHKYTFYFYPTPVNYMTSSVISYTDMFNVSQLPSDAKLYLPQMKIHRIKKQVRFNPDNHLTGGLYTTYNAIFYPAISKRIPNWSATRIFDFKEVVVPAQGNVSASCSAGFLGLDGVVSNTTTDGKWKTGLIQMGNCDPAIMTRAQAPSNITRSGSTNSTSMYKGLVTTTISNRLIKHLFPINTEYAYPGDIIDIQPFDVVLANNIETIQLCSTYPQLTQGDTFEWDTTFTPTREYVLSEPITVRSDEVPIELEPEWYEPSLRFLISIDGNTWYGINRQTKQIISTDALSNTFFINYGFNLEEINNILPNLKLIDTNFTNTFRVGIYLPYSTSKIKSLYFFIKFLKGQYIKPIISFDNGSTWYTYNPISDQLVQISYTDDNSAFDNINYYVQIPNFTSKIPQGTSTIYVRYLIKSNYSFDLPIIYGNTRYVSSIPKTMRSYAHDSNNIVHIQDIFDIQKRFGSLPYIYMSRDNITTLLNRDRLEGKSKFATRLYFTRLARAHSLTNLTILSEVLPIDINQRALCIVVIGDRGNVQPVWSIGLCNIEISTDRIIHGNRNILYSSSIDYKQVAAFELLRSQTDLDVTIYNTSSTVMVNRTITNYTPSLSPHFVRMRAGTAWYEVQVISYGILYQQKFDINNELPFEYNLHKEPSWLRNTSPTGILQHAAYDIIFDEPRLIISRDLNTWYTLDSSNTPQVITNPDSYMSVYSQGFTLKQYINFGIDRWRQLFNITDPDSEFFVYIRNTKLPLSFGVRWINFTEDEYMIVSHHPIYTIAYKKYVL